MEKFFNAMGELPDANTENGAYCYRSTKDSLLDLFYEAGNMRYKSVGEIESLVEKSYEADKKATVKLLGYMRDVRNGLGEREAFRTAMIRLITKENYKLFYDDLFAWCMAYGRADDYIYIVNDITKDDTEFNKWMEPVFRQLNVDMYSNNPTLLAKWLPSCNASSKRTRDAAKRIRKSFEWTEARYRKTLSSIRKKIDIVESRISKKDYTFDYQHVPSKAMLKYKTAFYRNDEERFKKYLDEVKSGDRKMNMKVATPQDVYRICFYGYGWCENSQEKIDFQNTAWENLKDVNLTDITFLPVLDTSGSMMGTPREIATPLSVYFSERLPKPFKDKIISFSNEAKFFDLSNEKTAFDKFKRLDDEGIVESTNIESVLHLVFSTAKEYGLSQSEIPSTLVFFSDMQFNVGTTDPKTAYHKAFKKIADSYGYELPKIVYWDIDCYGYDNKPVQKDEQGVVLISGSSQNAINALLQGYDNPLDSAMATINSSEAGKQLLEAFLIE